MTDSTSPSPPPPLSVDEARQLAAERIERRYDELGPAPEYDYVSEERYSVTGTLITPPRPPEDYPWVDGVPVCETCNLQHTTVNGNPSCAGHRRHYRTPCRKPPLRGMHLCSAHGGSPMRARQGHARRLAEAEAMASLADVEVQPIGNPIDELEKTAAEAVALKKHFADVVAQLKDQYRFTDDKGAEHLDARVSLYERALDRVEKFLSNLVKIGFEERRLQLDENRAALVSTFIRGVLADLGFSFEDERVRLAIETWAVVLDGEPAPRELEDEHADEVEFDTSEYEGTEVDP